MKKFICFYFLFLLFSFNSFTEGFESQTLIKTINDYSKIEDIKIGDSVVSYDFTNSSTTSSVVVNIKKEKTNSLLKIDGKSETFFTNQDQLFFDLNKNGSWEKVNNVKIFFSNKENLEIKKIQELNLQEKFDIYKITVSPYSNFFITEFDILVHNHAIALFFPIIAANIATAIKAVTYSGITAFFGKKLFEIFKNKSKKQTKNSCNKNISCSQPGPKKPKKDDDKDDKKDSCKKVIRGKGKAPEKSDPDSIYEKIDNEDHNLVVSRTYYDSYGRPMERIDYFRGSKVHRYFVNKLEGEAENHKHIFKYNEKGQRISEEAISLD